MAVRLKAVGVEALFVTASPELEPITALGGVALVGDLVLGAVVPLSSERLPTIVAKRATTLALMANDRVALIFRDDEGGREVELLEAVKAASMMSGDGPLDFVGSTIRLVGAYNEPRPDREATLGVGAWTASPSELLAKECDLVIVDGVADPGTAGGQMTVAARRGGEGGVFAAPTAVPVLIEIDGGDLDRICAIARAELQL